MNDDQTELKGCLMGALAAIVVIPLSSVIQGWVLSKLWAWFIVTTFGLPPLGVLRAIGLTLVVRYLTHQKPHMDKDDDWLGAIVRAFMFTLTYTALTLGIGWVVYTLNVTAN